MIAILVRPQTYKYLALISNRDYNRNKMLFIGIIQILLLIQYVCTTEIRNIRFSNLKLDPLTDQAHPHQGWKAAFDFQIPDSFKVYKDDYFELELPRVYIIKFAKDSTELLIPLKDRNSEEIFHCSVPQQAAYKYKSTILRCVTLTDLAPHPEISGHIEFSLSFSNGDSTYQYELENANYFESGLNNIEFTQELNAEVYFDAAKFNDHFYTTIRSTTYKEVEIYFLSMRCPNGYLLGGSQKINFDSKDANCQLNCNTPQIFVSKHFNDWWFPKSYQEIVDADILCFGNNLWITIGEQERGHLLWVNAMQDVADGQNTLYHDVFIEYTCSDTIAKTTYQTEHTAHLEYRIYEGTNTAIAEVPASVPSPSKLISSLSTISFSKYETSSSSIFSLSSGNTSTMTTSKPSTYIITTTVSKYSTSSTFTASTSLPSLSSFEFPSTSISITVTGSVSIPLQEPSRSLKPSSREESPPEMPTIDSNNVPPVAQAPTTTKLNNLSSLPLRLTPISLQVDTFPSAQITRSAISSISIYEGCASLKGGISSSFLLFFISILIFF
ncbi:Alpha-agglutinin [Nakaseomyces glabratus]|nr:Alpha-agglutinin [Nakaseomyces glabratus]